MRQGQTDLSGGASKRDQASRLTAKRGGIGVCCLSPAQSQQNDTGSNSQNHCAEVLAIEALSEIADEETYILSDDERTVLESALERAKRGEFASPTDIDEVLNKPWS